MSFTTGLLRAIFNLVIWVFVPLIAITILFYTRRVISKTNDKKVKSSMLAGFWAGFVLFIMVLIYQVGLFVASGFPDKPIYQGFNIALAIGTGITAFLLFLAGKWIASQKLGSFAVLTVTFLSFYTLLDYIFIRGHNKLILSLTLGLVFGFLVFFASAPPALRRTFQA